jgi:ribosomal protein S18 acetylase RimI-like enzyme
MVIVVTPDSPARRLANADEAELHLLAVDDAYRGVGLGRALVSAAIEVAKELGFRKIVLWTQPSMTAAQKLYESTGFVRADHRDPTINGMRFLAYESQR